MTRSPGAPTLEERWGTFHRYGPYGLLLVGLVISVGTSFVVGMDRADWYVAGGLTAAALALQVWWGRAATDGPSAAGIFYYFTPWAIGFVLNWLNPFFAFYTASRHFHPGPALPRPLATPPLFPT